MTVEQKMEMKKITSIAPARTCLFGDHQDYLHLPIIACAIDRHITLNASANDTDELVIHTPDINKKRIVRLDDDLTAIERNDHLLAALKVLRAYGCVPNKGYNINISGNIAINAGTSSSSAVVISWIQFLLEAYGCNVPITKEFVSQIAYEAEVAVHGAPGGRMDQYSIGLGNILYLETGATPIYEVFNTPLEGLIVAESGVPKQTVGLLNELKEYAFLAVNKVKEKFPGFKLIDAKISELPALLNYLPKALQPYLYAAITNHDITQRALLEFRKTHLDIKVLGALMNEHHSVLKNHLRLTVPKIDSMIEGALASGALGAKIVGSGRGGSIVVLSPEAEEQTIINALLEAGAKDAYKVKVDPGARIEKIKK